MFKDTKNGETHSFDLQFCSRCLTMTNHLEGLCQQCSYKMDTTETTMNKLRQKIGLSDFKHECCDGECRHDDCCGKVPENCPKPHECTAGKTCTDTDFKLTGYKGCPHLHLGDMQAFLPYFISDEFPKGKSKARGQAILHVALFLDWMKKHTSTT